MSSTTARLSSSGSSADIYYYAMTLRRSSGAYGKFLGRLEFFWNIPELVLTGRVNSFLLLSYADEVPIFDE